MRTYECVQDTVGAIAWCHGVSGDPAVKNVLLGSKYRCRYVSSISELVKYWRRVSWSLCHGNCGSFLVLEKAKTFFEECSIDEKYIFKRKDITLLSQEK